MFLYYFCVSCDFLSLSRSHNAYTCNCACLWFFLFSIHFLCFFYRLLNCFLCTELLIHMLKIRCCSVFDGAYRSMQWMVGYAYYVADLKSKLFYNKSNQFRLVHIFFFTQILQIKFLFCTKGTNRLI